jgi:hypothetical protein
MHPVVGTEACVCCSDLLHVARRVSKSGSCVTVMRRAKSEIGTSTMDKFNFGKNFSSAYSTSSQNVRTFAHAKSEALQFVSDPSW